MPETETQADNTDVAAAAAAATGQQNGQQSGQQNGGQGEGQQSGNTDKGFPENTPVANMTDVQKAAYYKHHNRQADNKLSAFKGVTPEQIQEMQSKIQQYEDSKLQPDEKALKDAATKAAKEAKDASDAEWRTKYQTSQLRGIAAGIVKDQDKLNGFLGVADPSKFARPDGEIDEDKLIGHLTAMFGETDSGNGAQSNGQQQQRNWGQNSGGSSTVARPGDAGMAAAEKRFGKPTK